MKKQSKIVKKLGRGTFSTVYLQIINEQQFACKKIKLPLDKQNSICYLMDEINSLRSLNHPNLVKCYGFTFKSFETFNIYLEYIKGETLDDFYKSTTILNKEQLLFYWIFQVSLALQYMEDKGIVHRDLKPQNILVDENGIIKIVDFGVSKMLITTRSNIVGTPCYLAPELVENKQIWLYISFFCHRSDIWSVGVMIYSLIHSEIPFKFPTAKQKLNNNEEMGEKEKEERRENERVQFYKQIISREIKFCQKKCSGEMICLLKGLLQKRPSDRLKASQILQHPSIRKREKVFKKIYNQALQRIQ